MSFFKKKLRTIFGKQMSEMNESDRAFFEAIQSLSNDFLFRLDLRTRCIELFGRARGLYDLPEKIPGFPEAVFDFVQEEDQKVLCSTFENMKQGQENACFIRFKTKKGPLRWHRYEYVLRYDKDGVPIQALGKIIDVHEQKQLEDRISLDGLTGCLRKESFESLVENELAISPDKQHALFIVDVDNFKAINDNLGHQFGDMVLREIGERLLRLFRASDYVGRVGGDEFMIFMREVDDLELVEKKAKAMLKAIDITYNGARHAYRISGSIGIAFAPKNGSNFSSLYQNADIALYDVKNRGKNGYTIYHGAMSKGTMENTTPFDVAARTLSQHFDPEFVAEVFNLLFESKDLDVSMQSVLKCVGTQFGASRFYIFEPNSENLNVYDNTYEWCAPGIEAQIEELQGLPIELVGQFFDMANEAGIYYCNDLKSLDDEEAYELMASQGIQSFLHSYVNSGDAITCVLGVDDCTRARVWSPIEISTIMYISKIIAQFLKYKNAIEIVHAISEDRLSVLDSLNYFAYIIDAETHTLSYFNKRTSDALPDLRVGDICYEKLRGYDKECANCPLKSMQEQGLRSTRTVLYNRILGIPVLVNASLLPRFDGKESVFVSSNDITDLVAGDSKVSLCGLCTE